MDTLELIVTCPDCHGGLTFDVSGWACRCGTSGPRIAGFLDFTAGAALPVANGGMLDLEADERRAVNLLASEDSYAAMHRRQIAHDEIEAEVGERHGAAILSKVDAYLEGEGRRPTGGEWALEAGGGFGAYVSGFAKRFRHVAFVDCSLVNLVVARQRAAENGVEALFVRADVTRLPFADGQFDFVHQNGVIEHVHTPEVMLSEALRVRRGVYVCLSPNRYPITREPHFNVRLYGAMPRRIRISHRGFEEGTDLMGLRRLRRTFQSVGVDPDPFFLPPQLPTLARHTLVRRVAQAMLGTRFGQVVRRVVNGPLLPVAPYHIVVVA